MVSAVELEPAVAEEVGAEVERQTGREVELTSRVDERIIGGIVLLLVLSILLPIINLSNLAGM